MIISFFRKIFESPNVANILTIVASIFAIAGVSIVSTVGPLFTKTTAYNRNEQEEIIQKINVTESKDYIDNILGTPKTCTELDIPLKNGTSENGQKNIYSNQFYIVICYFRQDNSLLGYFIINKDTEFNPILYRGQKIFGKRICDIDLSYEKLISYYYGDRNDTSSYYISFSHHHLDTLDCFIGVGVSMFGDHTGKDLNKVNSYIKSISENDNFKNIIYSDNELFGYLDRTTVSKFTELNKVKINTFANFKQNENIDLLEFFKREFNYKLAITYSEYCYLNDNTYWIEI